MVNMIFRLGMTIFNVSKAAKKLTVRSFFSALSVKLC
jgi:hypothetical protein